MHARLEEPVAQARLGGLRSDQVVTRRVPRCVVTDSGRIYSGLATSHGLRFLRNDIEPTTISVTSVLRAKTSLATFLVEEGWSIIAA